MICKNCGKPIELGKLKDVRFWFHKETKWIPCNLGYSERSQPMTESNDYDEYVNLILGDDSDPNKILPAPPGHFRVGPNHCVVDCAESRAKYAEWKEPRAFNIYIASSWKNQHAVQMLTSMLRRKGHEVL